MQQPNKVMFSSPGLKDFAPGGEDGILYLPDGQVRSFLDQHIWEYSDYRRTERDEIIVNFHF